MAAGCASTVSSEEVQLHTVSSESVVSPATGPREGMAVTFRLAVAEHLDRPEIAVRSGAGLRYSERNQWAEPLEDGLDRLLRSRLVGAGGVSRVLPPEGGSGLLPELIVTVAVDRFEGETSPQGKGRALVDAGWRVARADDPYAPTLASGVYAREAEPWDGEDFERLRQLLTELADDLAEAVATSVSEAVAGIP